MDLLLPFRNPIVDCESSAIPRLNLRQWQEGQKTTTNAQINIPSTTGAHFYWGTQQTLWPFTFVNHPLWPYFTHV